ncbi:putative uncharacterized protein DDB_G0287457 [Hydra vulgaris]|uniref:snRNA-activating protein complex subunit 5 n=1 Tax=Hydra vulgaris TaxID=6087 RepID=A0ABM4CHQ9_HYDVU
MSSLYRSYLSEEEKYLMALQRNLKDQISRLKVEEMTLLSLISNFTSETNSSTNQTNDFEKETTQSTQPISSDLQYNNDSDENISLQELRSKLVLVNNDKKNNEVNDLTNDQSVNKIPLKFEFNLNNLPNTLHDSENDFEEEHYDNEHDDEEESDEFL